VKATDALLDEAIAADPDRSARLRILESVPGVGAVVAKALIADLPELGRLGKRTLSALVGVAVQPRQRIDPRQAPGSRRARLGHRRGAAFGRGRRVLGGGLLHEQNGCWEKEED
jgi:transposase